MVPEETCTPNAMEEDTKQTMEQPPISPVRKKSEAEESLVHWGGLFISKDARGSNALGPFLPGALAFVREEAARWQ